MLDNVRILNDDTLDKRLVFNKVTDGIRIKEVSGLGPVNAAINTSAKGNGDGVNYNSRSIGARNIVLSLALSRSGAKTVESIRRDVYSYFPVGEEVELHFESSGVAYQIHGRVESAVPEIFTKEPTVQVSVICVDPYFHVYSGTVNSITLPNSATDYGIEYQGRVKSGIIFETEIIGTPPPTISGYIELRQNISSPAYKGFRIYDFDIANVTSGAVYDFRQGDKIRVVTIPGQKEAIYIRNNKEYNIMGALKDEVGKLLNGAQWPILSSGRPSTFRYNSTVYAPAHLATYISWDILIDGL